MRVEAQLQELGYVLPDAPKLHARTAFGVAALPLNLPVVISAEVAFE